MTKRNETSFFPGFVMILLAWLGLAGLSDAIVDWQAWFEQGVMQHWRSVKEWVIAILLWWVPFRVPSWLIDYIVIGTILIRTSDAPRWNENWLFGPEQAVEKYGYIPLGCKMEWIMSHVFTPQRLPLIILSLMIWPIMMLTLIIEAIRGKAFSPKIKTSASVKRRQTIAWLFRIMWCFVGFIPFLFVCSTILYQHG